MSNNEELRQYDSRPYQIELYKSAKEKNIIACLGTGTGKTFISILLMSDPKFLSQLKGSYRSGEAKRTFFLVPTRPLVYQQKVAIKTAPQTSDLSVGHFTGDMNVDYYNKEKWDEELDKYQVIVMTAQILLDMLNHSYISLDRINLLVIDEVHWGARKKNKKDSGHPYKQIMNNYNAFDVKRRPRVLGLSATPINCSVLVHNFPEAIRDIEKTYNAVCMTADAGRYGTNPKEAVWCFDNDNCVLSSIASAVVKSLEKFINELKTISKGYKDQRKCPTVLVRMKKVFRTIKNILSDPEKMERQIMDEQSGEVYPLFMTWMGVWCGSVAVKFYINEINQYKEVFEELDPLQTELWVFCIKYLQKIVKLFEKEIGNDSNAAFNTASPKMRRFLELLQPYQQREGLDSELCGIVFVNQRCVAKVLCDWLLEMKKMYPNSYGFLKVGWVVGHSARPGLEAKIAANSDKRQQEVIKEFHDKKLNLLIATSVLEEGLDVRKCNLVVRYDRLNTFREYLQSKGRARADNAHFYMMTTIEDHPKLEIKLNDFQKMEEMVKNINNNQRNDSSIMDFNVVEDPELVFVNEKTGAKIVGRSAISLLYQYCQKLPTDSFTHLEPVFTITNDEVYPFLFNAVVKFPVNCPLKGSIKTETSKADKDLAKRVVAVKACKQLFEIGELDEHLFPLNREKSIETYVEKLGLKKETLINDQKGRENPTKQRTGTRSAKDIVVKQIAHIFLNERKDNNYYYLSGFGLKFPKTDELSNNCLTFGLITHKPIENKTLFSVFLKTRRYDIIDDINSSEIKVDFNPIMKIPLSSEQKYSIDEFHRYVFEEILKFSNENLVFDPQNSEFNAFIVPLNNGSNIDWNFINKTNTFGSTSIRELTPFEQKEYQFKRENFVDTVFYPWYWKDQNGSPFIHCFYSQEVSKLCSNSDWIEDNYSSFAEYFLKKHKILVNNKTLPLIQGRSIGGTAQLKPYSKTRKEKKSPQFFPPELLTIHPFPASLWRQALCLPAILYRLNHIYLSEELRQRIYFGTNPRIGSLNSNNCLELKFNSIMKCSTSEMSDSKRLFDSLDSDDECDGHQYIDENILSFISKKQRRVEPTIKQPIKAVPKSKTEVILNTICDNNIIGDNILKDLSRFTDATITEFRIIIAKHMTNDRKNSSLALEKIMEEIYSPKRENIPKITYGEAFPFVFKENIEPFIREKYDSKMGDPIVGPKIDLLLQALTMVGSNDAFNLERLEVIGDSFLKLVTSCYVYFSCPELDEGRLSYLRQIQICNCNLYLIGCEKKINKRLVPYKWFPKNNWLPPGYHISEENDLKILSSLENKKQKNSNQRSDSFRRNIINNKSIADSIEALIGAHLMIGGNKSALIFMEWLGLKVKPLGANDIDYLNERQLRNDVLFNWLPKPKDPNCREDLSQTEFEEFIRIHYSGANLDHFEQIIGYQFQNKAYLIQALTHSSFHSNEFTDCYQKLEFLGDAIIDFLISRHIFSTPNKEFSPGELTDLRSALVNNSFFASIAIKYKFHKFLKNFSSDLFRAIQSFERNFLESETDSVINSINKLTEEECIDIEEIEVPKALGDIFESVAGAIFLDNGLSLDGVWKVYFKLLKPEIDYFTENIPKMPVQKIWELCPSLHFGESEKLGRKTRVVLSARGKQYGGVGKNRKFAKIAAAKNALKDLKPI